MNTMKTAISASTGFIFQKLVQTTDGIAVNLGNPIIDFDFIIDIRVVGYPEVANGVPLCINRIYHDVYDPEDIHQETYERTLHKYETLYEGDRITSILYMKFPCPSFISVTFPFPSNL